MNHSPKRRPQGRGVSAVERFFEFLEGYDEKLDIIIGKQDRLESKIDGSRRFAKSVAESELKRDKDTMLNLDNMRAEVAENTDLLQSVVSMRTALEAERDDLEAQLANADASNQALIDEITAKQDANNKALASVVAIASNTPAASLGGT